MHILFATDGSECSRFAAKLLSRIPFPAETRVTLMTCVEVARSPELEMEVGEVAQSLQDQIHRRARQILDEEINRLKTTGWTISTLLCEGIAAPEILSACREQGIDLIIMGARGHSTLRHILLGSVSRKVARHAPCSVLIARPSSDNPRAGDKTIKFLVGVDGSDAARQAVNLLSSLSWQKSICVTLLHAIELVTPYRMDILQQMDPIWQRQKREAAQNLAQAVELLQNADVQVESVLEEGDSAAEVLFKQAREGNADILMLGDKGRNVLENLLLGSLSEEALHHAPCSVWLSRLRQNDK